MINDTPYENINVFLNSRYATTKTNDGNLMFDLKYPIHRANNCDILLSIDTFQFTNCFYTVGNNNNMLYYDISGVGIFSTKITNGFYNIDDLTILLNDTFNNVLFFYWDYYTFKISITCGSFFKLINGDNNIYEILGFDKNGFTDYTKFIIGPNLFNTMQVQQLQVCVTNLAIKSLSVQSVDKLNILTSLRVNVGNGEIQNFFNVSPFKYIVNETYIDSIEIKIVDQNYNIVEFNGIDWFCTLSFSFQYKKQFIMPTYLTDYNTDNDFETADYYLDEEANREFTEKIDEIIDENNLLNENKNI